MCIYLYLNGSLASNKRQHHLSSGYSNLKSCSSAKTRQNLQKSLESFVQRTIPAAFTLIKDAIVLFLENKFSVGDVGDQPALMSPSEAPHLRRILIFKYSAEVFIHT